MFDENLIGIRAESSKSETLLDMLRKFKVPVGLNEQEREAIKAYFTQKDEKKGFFRRKFGKKQSSFDAAEGMMNDHSRVFYLMSPENRFLGFYNLDLEEHELANNMIEDISYDLGQKYIGTGKRPPNKIGGGDN